MFFVVDEGPGLSGSSFLAVAEAMAGAGVPIEQITLVPSFKPDLSSLLAENARARWSRFRVLPLRPTRYVPGDAKEPISAGGWRNKTFSNESEWPGVWDWTERKKYFSQNGRCVFRFDGHGHYGKAVRQRSETLAGYGWGPESSHAGEGFSVSPWVAETAEAQRVNRRILADLAEYCAFRAEHFGCEEHSQAVLEEMTHINLERGLGVSHSITLPLECPVISDARMMPHEWIRRSNRRMLKVDASSHGDDHFYPGPTDIAWDIAGAITEWELDREASELLVHDYQCLSHDAVANRLPAYTTAYCAFRLGFTLSAAKSVKDDLERWRFGREAERYRRRLCGLLHLATAA